MQVISILDHMFKIFCISLALAGYFGEKSLKKQKISISSSDELTRKFNKFLKHVYKP